MEMAIPTIVLFSSIVVGFAARAMGSSVEK
jgi:hypothetical protein